MSIASKGDIEGRLSPQLVLSIAMSLGVVMHEWMAPLRSAYMADTLTYRVWNYFFNTSRQRVFVRLLSAGRPDLTFGLLLLVELLSL